MCFTDRENVYIPKAIQDLTDDTFVCQQTSNVLMQNLKALFRDKFAKFRDVISMNIFLLILVSSILDVIVVRKTRITLAPAIIGAEAFQVKLQMTLRARHPALVFLQTFQAQATSVARTRASFDIA